MTNSLMELSEFCSRLVELEPMSNIERALAVLWFEDRLVPGAEMQVGQIRKVIVDAGLGDPHVTRLRDSLKKHPETLSRKGQFKIKASARQRLSKVFETIVGPARVEVDHVTGFLPAAVWENTRGYIEVVCRQLNGSYAQGWYDAASVMLRRLIETLIIEVYEHESRLDQIKDTNGHCKMLNALIGHVSGDTKLHLGRESKKALGAMKSLGDRSAHNRRYTAKKGDLDKVESALRVLAEELIVLAQLRS